MTTEATPGEGWNGLTPAEQRCLRLSRGFLRAPSGPCRVHKVTVWHVRVQAGEVQRRGLVGEAIVRTQLVSG